MKKQLVILSLMMLLPLVSCNSNGSSTIPDDPTTSHDTGSTPSDKAYIARFYINDGTDAVYQNLVVNEGADLIAPENPFREGYVFSGWYLDKEGKQSYAGFGNSINTDISLYAKWEAYEDLNDVEKIQFFIDSMKSLEGVVNHTLVKSSGTLQYYFPQQIGGSFYNEYDYTRYKDIVVEDEYTQEAEDAELTKTAQTQYFDDGTRYYQIYDSTDDSLDKLATATIAESGLSQEDFYSIGFVNLNLGLLSDLSYYLSTAPENLVGFNIQLLDVTGLDKKAEAIEFGFSYGTSVAGEDGISMQSEYYVSGVLNLINGKINRSTVSTVNMIGVDGEVALVIEENTSTKYDLGEFSDYTGTRLDPDDFQG